MWFFWLAGWLSTILLLLCATLCVACGLYYIAEVVEEYPQPTKRLICWCTWGAAALNIGMGLFEKIPWLPVVAVGVAAHLVYLTLLPAFPNTSFASLPFLGSVVLFLAHQYVVFNYFTRHWHPFSDVVTYFVLCVWLVPFAFFVSLSSVEESLPTASEEWSNGSTPRKDRASILSLFKYLSRQRDSLLPAVRPASKAM